MAIDLDVVAAEIGKRHGIKITRDDPIMIVVTMIALLEQEMFQQKQYLIGEAVSEVEAFITRNNEYITAIVNKMLSEAKGQAQAIINQTLIESKASLQEVVAQVIQSKTASIQAKLEPSIVRVEHAAKMSLAAACVAVLAAGIALWAAL